MLKVKNDEESISLSELDSNRHYVFGKYKGQLFRIVPTSFRSRCYEAVILDSFNLNSWNDGKSFHEIIKIRLDCGAEVFATEDFKGMLQWFVDNA